MRPVSRKALLYAAALAAGGYASYSLYKSEFFRHKKHRLALLLGSVYHLVDSLSNVADTSALLSSDLKAFLQSGTDEVPQSIRQVFKIFQCREFQEVALASATRLCEALVHSSNSSSSSSIRTRIPRTRTYPSSQGVPSSDSSSGAEGWTRKNRLVYQSSSRAGKAKLQPQNGGLGDRLLVKLFSENGRGFASVVVGSAARSFVLAAFEEMHKSRDLGVIQQQGSWDAQGILDLASSSTGKALIADSIQMLVETAVSTYLDKTRDVNVFEEIVEAVTKPGYQAPVKDLFVAVSSGAMDTLVRTSHSVVCNPQYLIVAKGGCQGSTTSSGSVTDTISRALAVPSNRKLVLEVAGTVTSEAVHSFCQVLAGSCAPILTSSRQAVKFRFDSLITRPQAALVVVMLFLAMLLHYVVNFKSSIA